MSPRRAGVGAAPMETVDTIDTIGVWRDFHHRLVGYVARRVANVADAEDIVQEVMLRIHRHRDQLGDVRHVSAWVYRITDNAITDYYRGADRRERPVADLPAAHRLAGQASVPSDQDGSDGRARADLAACLQPMMDQLAVPYRQALVLTEFEGLTQGEAAARSGLSVSGMKSRVQRARRQLKQRLLLCCDVHLDARGGVTGYAPNLDTVDTAHAVCVGCPSGAGV